MKKFNTILAALTIVFGVLLKVGSSKGFFSMPSYGFEIILLLSLSTGIIFFLLRKIKPSSFTQSYLLSIVVKLLIGGIFISIILFIDKGNAMENALTFIIAYFLFTALEVFFLFQKINKPLSN